MLTFDFSQVNWMFLMAIMISKAAVFVAVVIFTLLLTRPMNFSKAGLFAIFCTQSNDFALGYPIGKLIMGIMNPAQKKRRRRRVSIDCLVEWDQKDIVIRRQQRMTCTAEWTGFRFRAFTRPTNTRLLFHQPISFHSVFLPLFSSCLVHLLALSLCTTMLGKWLIATVIRSQMLFTPLENSVQPVRMKPFDKE